MPKILAVSTAIPPHRLDQSFARREMARLCEGQPHLERLIPVFDRTGVDTRHLVHEPEWYLEPRSFEERNDEYAAKALELTQKAVRACLARSGATPDQIDHIYVVTTTGLTTPSLDALLAGLPGPPRQRAPLAAVRTGLRGRRRGARQGLRRAGMRARRIGPSWSRWSSEA